MVRTVLLRSLSLLLVGFSFNIETTLAQSTPESEGLVEIKAKVDLAYIRPGVDWSKFKTVELYELNVTREAQDASRSGTGTRRSSRESWVIPDADVELMKDEFARIMQREIEKKDAFEVVAQAGSDTLIVVPTIIDIYLTAPIESTRRTQTSRGGTYTESSGALVIAIALADGETGEVIARAVDERHAVQMWRENNRVRNLAEMRQVFAAWGKQLRKRVQDFAAGDEPKVKN